MQVADPAIVTEKRNNIIDAVNEYGSRLLGFIRGRVSNEEDAEDILQEVWYQFSSLKEVEALESVSGWLYRVARNKITDRFRKKGAESLEDLVIESDEGEFDLKEILLADAKSPEEEFMKKMFWDEFLAALEDMPAKQKSVFVLNELEDKTLQEIADLQGEKLKTVISRKGYAVKFLRGRLSDLYNEFID